jgi:hypothetical protein
MRRSLKNSLRSNTLKYKKIRVKNHCRVKFIERKRSQPDLKSKMWLLIKQFFLSKKGNQLKRRKIKR